MRKRFISTTVLIKGSFYQNNHLINNIKTYKAIKQLYKAKVLPPRSRFRVEDLTVSASFIKAFEMDNGISSDSSLFFLLYSIDLRVLE